MNNWLKKFIISFIFSSFFYVSAYFLISLYDKTGDTMLWLYNNIYYLVFLFISIVWWLTLYGNNDNKSKFIISVIFIINFIYLIFLFSLSHIWLTQIQWFLLIGFLLLWIISINLKNLFGNIITVFALLWILITIFSVFIPLYEEWPDVSWFEEKFKNQFLVYSMAGINKELAVLEKDKKKYKLLNWISNYDLKISWSWSEIIFKSDKQYQNSFWYILFKNKDILQIYPQSAIKINKDLEIEIITWIIKYFPQNITSFTFTSWGNIPSIMVDQEHIDIIYNRYNNKLKDYILEKIWGDSHKNKTILYISKNTLEMLNKIFPKQFEKNIENFKTFDEYLDYNLDEKDYVDTIDQKKIQQWIIKDIKDWLGFTEVIK